MKDTRKAIYSWAFYDWANSAFATTVMAGFFPLFFKHYWANPGAPQESTFYLGLANSLASIFVAVISPFLGAVADRGAAKKRFLFLFLVLGASMTGCLWLVPRGDWPAAALVYILSTIGFSGGNVFYDSLLPSVASESKVDQTSSLGYALGYIGGGLLFLLNVLMYLRPAFFGIGDTSTAVRLAFVSVALWWIVFALPLLLLVKEPTTSGLGISAAVGAGLRQLRGTFGEIRRLRVVGLFLLAYWFYIDGVDTVIRMAVDFGASLNFPASSLITALLMVQFVAFPATMAFSWFAVRAGVRKAILIAIGGYCCITLLAVFMTSVVHFYLLALLVGLFQGGLQALSRSFYTRLIPAGKEAEFFGFFNMLGKFAAVLGPVMIGSVTLLTGSNRLGILTIIILFIAGFMLLLKVDPDEGRRLAREHM